MGWIVIALLLIVIIIAVIVASQKNTSTNKGSISYPYIKKGTLLSSIQQSFLTVLEQAIGQHYRIYAQVRLADLLAVKSGTAKSERTSAQNRINFKQVDFVLCHHDTLEIVCAIELDDSSHQKDTKKAKDSSFVDEACRVAGLPLVRFPSKGLHSVSQVRSALVEVLGMNSANPIEPVKTTHKTVAPSREKNTEHPTTPTCPKCGSEMVLRTIKRGANTGNKMWGCSHYPTCKGQILGNP